MAWKAECNRRKWYCFLLLMVQFFVVKNYVVPFAKKVYHFVIDDYEEFKQWQTTKRQKGEGKND